MNAPVEAGLTQALAALGLRSDADARAVRRAYALQLKQIDQATQLQEFQALREAYEFALGGIARREAQLREEAPPDEPEAPAPPVARPATGFAPPDSAELARAVFQPFAARAAAGFKDEPDATAALQDALADERLLNLEARTLFELQVAHLLMSGWQPGHEFLFGPACELFSWEKDRAHLRVFGQMGAALDAAINEKLIFFRQDPWDFDLQRNVIRRLRMTEMPSVAIRRADLPMVQLLVQRYPNWLRLITSQANINSWFQELPDETAAATAPAERLSTASAALPEPDPMKALSTALMTIFGVLLGVFVIFSMFTSKPPSPSVAVTATHHPLSSRPGDQFIYLGDVTFVRRDGEVIVDDVDPRPVYGPTSLKAGDRLLNCKANPGVPLILVIESGRCGGIKKTNDMSVFQFKVQRDDRETTASLAVRQATAEPALSTR